MVTSRHWRVECFLIKIINAHFPLRAQQSIRRDVAHTELKSKIGVVKKI